jgi:uncharacterized protein DUF4157
MEKTASTKDYARSTAVAKASKGGKSLPSVPVLRGEENAPVQKAALHGIAPLQMKGVEEELPAQGKFVTQLKGEEEELPAQGKFVTQLKGEEEELPAQGKFITQLKGEEEELPAQGKFITQLAEATEEEPLQRRPIAPVQRKANSGAAVTPLTGHTAPVQKKANNTGMPDNLKSGMEQLGGFDMSDVKVHYNSPKPAQLQAHAYAQGTDIHVAPGQEQHLPHEAWHVVQQKQGRVKATLQMRKQGESPDFSGKTGVPVNDDAGLEHEADVMGQRSLQSSGHDVAPAKLGPSAMIVQRVKNEGLRAVTDPQIDALKQRTILILQQLNTKAQSWANTWGEDAEKAVRKKVKGVLNGEKGESMESMVAKKIWENLTAEEKLRVCVESIGVAGRVVGTLITEAVSGEKSKEEEAPRERERSEGSGIGGYVLTGVADSLSALTGDDIAAMYRVMKRKGEIMAKVDEAKKEIEDALGNVAEGAGRSVGEIRDEHAFEKLIAELQPEFSGAIAKFQELRSTILTNGDKERYNDELAGLQDALVARSGPWAAMKFAGLINAEARLAYPALCQKHIEEINSARRFTLDPVKPDAGFLEKAAALVLGGVRAPAITDQSAVEKENTASALKRLVNKDWSRVTKYWSVPTGVKKLRAIDRGMDADKYLAKVKTEAAKFGAAGSNRDEHTTIPLYAALTALDPANAQSLIATTAEIRRIEGVLG